MKKCCPICKSESIEVLFESHVPVLQNRVYEIKNEAINCHQGIINLAHCNDCNFSFNASFDESKIVYDEEYDNAVPSKLFADYYQSIGEYLYKKYNLENGVVYDIGCGKGTFLKMLCSLYPNIKGVGIDPSYEGDLNPMENLTFIREFFKHEQVTDAPNLILSRHVFEHIEFPKDFLEIIREPIINYPNVPVFIEVPDFNWIVENKTFWDLCYEHCNYFSEKSLAEVFNHSWAQLTKITKSFNDQYLWVEGIFNPTNEIKALYHPFEIKSKGIYEFIDSIQLAKQKVLQLILDYKSKDYQTVVWGMATKGVIFTNNMDANATLIDFCIDINQEKQQKYSPISGHLIQSPTVLSTLKEQKVVIIVMNPNYVAEIKQAVHEYIQEAIFMDAHGTII